MSAIKDGGPAFPLENPRQLENGELFKQFPGMSMRDWFAGQALQGILANPATVANDGSLIGLYQMVAAAAYLTADGMIAAREKSGAS